MFTDRHPHAPLSPSGSKLWIPCPGSVYLQSFFPDDESEAAEEGTFAHAIAAARMNVALGRPLRHPETEDALRRSQAGVKFWTEELGEHVQGYVDRNLALIKEHPDAIVLVEQRVDFSNWVREGKGTIDLGLAYDDVIFGRDFKYGRGVDVDIDENTQLALYALGIYGALHTLYDFKRVIVEIDQPRRGGVKSADYTVDELLEWAEGVLRPAAERAWEAYLETKHTTATAEALYYNPGAHCTEGFCRARNQCAARANMLRELAAREPLPGAILTDEDLAEILPTLPAIRKWATEMIEWSTKEAVEQRRPFRGMKLVSSRSVRKVVEERAVVCALQAEGFARKDLYHSELLGITALEKLVGPSYLAKVVPEGAIVKVPGAPTLVPETDPRRTWAPSVSADDEFSDTP